VANTERKRLEGLNQQSTTISGKDERTYTRNESSRDQATGTEDVANSKGTGTRENDEGLRSRTSGVSRGQGTSGTEEDVANANINGTERNQPEDGQGSRTQQSGEDVADTYARLSNGTYEEIQSRGQTSDTSSEGRTNVADTESIESNVGGLEQRQRERSGQREVGGASGSTQGSQNWWLVEPNVGRVAHGVSGRVHRLKGLGNSIVPQIAEEIGRAIIKAEHEME